MNVSRARVRMELHVSMASYHSHVAAWKDMKEICAVTISMSVTALRVRMVVCVRTMLHCILVHAWKDTRVIVVAIRLIHALKTKMIALRRLNALIRVLEHTTVHVTTASKVMVSCVQTSMTVWRVHAEKDRHVQIWVSSHTSVTVDRDILAVVSRHHAQ